MNSRSYFYPVFSCLFAIFLAVFAAGCRDLNKGAEDRDPNIKRARERRAVGDYPGAIESYQKALDKRPDLARVHWEMASVYDQHLTNDIRAIYHYQRYLELEPKADRHKLVQDLIGASRMSFAASLPARPSEAVQEIARLKTELATLRDMLSDAREEIARLHAAQHAARTPAAASPATTTAARPAATPSTPTPTPTVAAPAPAPAPRPAPPQTASLEMYVVKPGDSLSRIASRVYGDASKWNVIFEANRTTLPKPESVRVGQELVIPR